MKLGLNYNLPAKDYHAYDALSNSKLSKLATSPAHFRYYCDKPEEKTKAMIFGSAMHSFLLERTLFDREFIFRPAGLDLRRTADKEIVEKLKKDNPGKEILEPEQGDQLGAMASAVEANACAAALLRAKGETELSILWKCPETKAKIKSRIDRYALVDGQPTLLDLKTTNDASPKGFAATMYRYRYYMQAALYLDGMSAIHKFDHTRFVFIVVEKEPPYAVGVYEIDSQAISAGQQEYKRLLQLHAECTKKNQWPSYAESTEPQLITLPMWAFRELEIEEV